MAIIKEKKLKKNNSPTKKAGKTKIKIIKPTFDLEEMVQAGLHFGHRTSRSHPKMKPYLSETRSTVHIIDLEKTIEKFKEALNFIQELISQGKTLILVGTKMQAKSLVRDIAEEQGLAYVNEKWVGGFFTNFGVILKRLEYFKDLEKKKKQGGLEEYTKKERIEFDKELRRLEMKFGGIKEINRLPEAIFVLDMKKDNLAIKEARMKGITVVAIADTNVDPGLADYPIPANDDAVSSIKYILQKVAEVIKEAKVVGKTEE